MPSFKARPLQLAVKEAGINPKLAKDEEIFYIFKLALWLMHKSLLMHVPRRMPEESIKLDLDAIWEIKKHISDLIKRKPLKDDFTFNRMQIVNVLLNEASALAGTVVKIYNKQDQSRTRILFIYQLCDKLKKIFDSLEGEDVVNPTTSINCSFDAIIKITYKQKSLISEEKDDRTKFCFCKESILKWYRQLGKVVPLSLDEATITLFEEAITELKTIMEYISYSASIGNKIHIDEINELLNTAASQIGEAATIYKSEKPATIQQRLLLLAEFTDQLKELHERLKQEKIVCH